MLTLQNIARGCRHLSRRVTMDSTIIRPSRSLEGRVAIITGAGALGDGIGNGRATAIMLAEDGCSVVCVDLKEDSAQRTADMIQEEGLGSAFAMAGDVTKPEHCQRIVETAVSKFGRLDILVNNVGILGPRVTAVEVDTIEFMKGLEINVLSMVQMAKFAIPAMTKNEGQVAGSIVNMGSVAGLRGGTPNLLYPTSKGAVVNMTRAMAANHAKERIRVNCLCPGMVYTPMMHGSDSMSDAEREARKARSLLGTEGNGWDVGAAVRFLASDQSRWMTGVILPLDAGTTAATGIGAKSLHDSTSSKE
ncbi:hypothetical protein LTR06_011226 [Exophiala xenobiotica]|nr:hypothetical protein LTR06_011226 [Exophiala xenobiotica]